LSLDFFLVRVQHICGKWHRARRLCVDEYNQIVAYGIVF
jgi:hypothetical protein